MPAYVVLPCAACHFHLMDKGLQVARAGRPRCKAGLIVVPPAAP